MTAPGPSALGRGVVINAGSAVPEAWAGAPVVTVDEAALADPGATVIALHEAWAARRPLVVALAVDPGRFRSPDSWDVEPWTLPPTFEAWNDRLHFLVWANTYDARGEGPPVWWWARKAQRAGAGPNPHGSGDVMLADGRPAWVDGGPRAPFDPADLGAEVVHSDSVELGRLEAAPPPVAPRAQLAPDQLAAVAHRSGPARVIAPAGSGKTRVLTERLRHLIGDRGYEPEGVLAVAYNKKAQEELQNRCAAFRPRVRTLNALGYSLLARALGRTPRVLDEREVRRIIEELVPRGQRRVNTDPIGPYIEGLSLARLGLEDPMEVENGRDDVPGLAKAFVPYREQLAAMGAVDFDEQVYGAIQVLLADGQFRRSAQADCRHLLVDEFQDLTPAHVLLLRLLATPGLDVFGVGDDDQVIYGHAGADPAFLVDYEALFPGAASHPLEVNYRCPVAVVEGARSLLSYNFRRVTKDIRPGPAAEVSVGALVVHRHPAGAGAGALQDVVQGWLGEGVSPASMAVLTRVNSLLLAPHVALAEAGVPLDSVLRPEVLDRTGVRAALAYLRIGAAPERIDGDDLAEVYRRPSRGFPNWITKWFRGPTTLPHLRALGDKMDDTKVAAKLGDLADDLALVAAAAANGTTREVLTVVKDRVGLGGAMGLLDASRAGEGGSSHLDDLEALEQVAGLHPDPATFESWLRTVFRREAEPGGVTLSTVHRVKGREWDRVAVFGVTAGLMPHRLAEDEEEERRVLHVAVTRGRHRVALLVDDSRPSPFLDELTGTAPHVAEGAKAAATAGRTAAAKVGAGRTTASVRVSTVEARPGLKFAANGGFEGTVTAVDDGGVNLSLESGASLRVAFGEMVTIRGRSAVLTARPDLSPDVERAEEALRAWRTERCKRDGVSAFIVLYDRHLRAIATRRPTTLAELRAVDGIGPTKLELYGEEILAVLEGLD